MPVSANGKNDHGNEESHKYQSEKHPGHTALDALRSARRTNGTEVILKVGWKLFLRFRS
jgi:hypothetical protein